MNIILIPPSNEELNKAIDYFNDQQVGLGDKFYNEFIRTTELIAMFPETWKKVNEYTHKINMKRFPYIVLYVIDRNDILITCIAHQHRNPIYLIDRIC